MASKLVLTAMKICLMAVSLMMLGGSMSACAMGNEASCKEEVLLNDGRTLIVERLQTYGGEALQYLPFSTLGFQAILNQSSTGLGLITGPIDHRIKIQESFTDDAKRALMLGGVVISNRWELTT